MDFLDKKNGNPFAFFDAIGALDPRQLPQRRHEWDDVSKALGLPAELKEEWQTYINTPAPENSAAFDVEGFRAASHSASASTPPPFVIATPL